jgi:hypothetical protein
MFIGEHRMRLTEQKLKNIIIEVITENLEQKERVMTVLRGDDESVQTVVIMSGQNPMAQSVSNNRNRKLQRDLESDLSSMGYDFERIGGVFGGLREKAVLIKNVKLEEMDEINRKYSQWGFVFGKRVFSPTRNDDGALQLGDDGIAGEYKMEYQMFKIRYDENHGFDQDVNSTETSQVIDGSSISGLEDNYSFIPHMGDEGKMVIPLYGKPVIPLTDEEMERILNELGSESQ